MTNQNQNDEPAEFHPAVTDFVTHISKTFHDRDALVAENLALRTRAEIAEGMVAHLKSLNEKVTAERDLYLRRTFVLTTRISAIRDVMDSIFEAAETDANGTGTNSSADALIADPVTQ